MVSLQDKIGDRDILQEARVEAGNAIYSTLVSYTTIGQTIWKATNVAKYNDYVVYDTVTTQEPSTPTVVE